MLSSRLDAAGNEKKYQRVEEFDVGLAKDIEEALLLANNSYNNCVPDDGVVVGGGWRGVG